MNQEAVLELVVNSQAGEVQALEQLMLYAYTPVSYLCRKLLRDDQMAREQTREILQILAQNLSALQEPEEFEAWLCRITSARCVQMIAKLRQSDAPEEPVQQRLSISGKSLDADETADAIEKMVDMLPENIRICIFLCCCGGMSSRTIARITGYSVDAVRTNLNRGYTVLQKMLEKYEQRGTQFSGIGSVADILRIAMYRVGEDNEALVMVYGILGKKLPTPPKPGRRIVWVLGILAAILLIADLVIGGIILLKMKNSTSDAFALPTIETTAAPTAETTIPTTVPTAVPTTQPETTEATEEETTVPTTEETEPEETQEATKATEKEEDSSSSDAAKPTGSGSKVPEEVPKTGEDGHTHRYLKTSTNFNCETGGTKRYLCSDCDYYYTEDLAPTGTHSFTITPGPANMDATCTNPGKSYKLCTKCNYGMVIDDPENKPPLGHDYSSSVKAPTATEQGYTLHTCSRCGDSYMDNYVDPVPQESEAFALPSEASADASGDAET